MNRKDFEEIGRVVRQMPVDERVRAAYLFAEQLEGHHSGFCRERFIKSCNVVTVKEKAP